MIKGFLALSAVFTVLSFASSANAQSGQPVQVKFQEVVRSIVYLPQYAALTNGYLAKEGLDVDMKTAWGGDKGTAALLTGNADIVLQGPETAIYVENSESPAKMVVVANLNGVDGLVLVSREKPSQPFDWKSLKGKHILGWRPGSTPELFAEYVLKQHGIEPQKDVTITTNIAVPSRPGAFMSGKGGFAIFEEPNASLMEQKGEGYVAASIGKELGPAGYTTYIVTEAFAKENAETVQKFVNAIYRAQRWVADADPDAAVAVAAKYLPNVSKDLLLSAFNRYREWGVYATTPVMDPAELEKMQDILISGGVLKQDKRVKTEAILDNSFAERAVATMK